MSDADDSQWGGDGWEGRNGLDGNLIGVMT